MQDNQIDAIAIQIKQMLQIMESQSNELALLRAFVLEIARQSSDFNSLKVHFLNATSHFAMKDLLFEKDEASRASLEKERELFVSRLASLASQISAKE